MSHASSLYALGSDVIPIPDNPYPSYMKGVLLDDTIKTLDGIREAIIPAWRAALSLNRDLYDDKSTRWSATHSAVDVVARDLSRCVNNLTREIAALREYWRAETK